MVTKPVSVSRPMSKQELTECDKEPIHVIGAVQSHICLIAIDELDVISYCSNQCESVIDVTADELLGKSLNSVFDREIRHTIRGALSESSIIEKPRQLYGLDLFADNRKFDIRVHLSNNYSILEVQLSEPQKNTFDLIGYILSRFQNSHDTESLLDSLCSCIRTISGFDRVMVYQFADDGTGEVVAESCETGIESFFGLRYPASDIPKQARALYIKNKIRLIANVNAETNPLRSIELEPLDLSMTRSRAVSPVHIQYLKNMKVAASMSLSLVVDNQLWGLVAAHHYQPRILDNKVLDSLELVSELSSLELSKRIAEERHVTSELAHDSYQKIVEALDGSNFIHDNINKLLPLFTQLIECDGVTFAFDKAIRSLGHVLDEPLTHELIKQLDETYPGVIYSTQDLRTLNEKFYGEKVAGALCIPISRNPNDYLIFFRESEVNTVRWAGRPGKVVTGTREGKMLTPRDSFEEWAETYAELCKAWSQVDLKRAEAIKIGLMETSISHLYEKQKIQAEANEKLELLITELNHRVRNILQLVSGIVEQSALSGKDTEYVVDALTARIMSLAKGHDQLTNASWSEVPLSSLLMNELSAYNVSDSFFSVKGEDVSLDPYAVTPVILVFHELVTNAAKYGAISQASKGGKITLTNSFNEDGDLLIEWQEQLAEKVKQKNGISSSFGMTIIKNVIPHELKGEADVKLEPKGLKGQFIVPKRYVTRSRHEMKAIPKAKTQKQIEQEKKEVKNIKQHPDVHVLVVEDNLVIGLDYETKLKRLKVTKTKICSDVMSALYWLERFTPDIALLDYNLGSECSLPIAEKLTEKSVPFAFITGYADKIDIPNDVVPKLVLTKPLTLDTLSNALSALCSDDVD